MVMDGSTRGGLIGRRPSFASGHVAGAARGLRAFADSETGARPLAESPFDVCAAGRDDVMAGAAQPRRVLLGPIGERQVARGVWRSRVRVLDRGAHDGVG